MTRALVAALILAALIWGTGYVLLDWRRTVHRHRLKRRAEADRLAREEAEWIDRQLKGDQP